MFKKIPHGIAVRVRGNDVDGYRIQYTYRRHQILRFMTMWFDHDIYIGGRRLATVPTLEIAQEQALNKYNDMIEWADKQLAIKNARKKAKKIVWEHP